MGQVSGKYSSKTFVSCIEAGGGVPLLKLACAGHRPHGAVNFEGGFDGLQ